MAPYGVAVDSAGDVFIADAGNNRVVEVELTARKRRSVWASTPAAWRVDASGDLFIG